MTTGILRTDCERIVDANGDAVLLRGVSHHGLCHDTWVTHQLGIKRAVTALTNLELADCAWWMDAHGELHEWLPWTRTPDSSSSFEGPRTGETRFLL